jgi:hypothetical protein
MAKALAYISLAGESVMAMKANVIASIAVAWRRNRENENIS